ncbi:unnamed protein product [Spirodela intermedia]|uniref:Uncharacterized protein n=1 Tax=Spirodela intermedia TaxID=51605 RepID=A0A7I8IAG6_SPIIN|nr:unnamed protein product [Spirodela intermedia]CAA6654528.1 unnamed protein product [Spirodela intermedia]
MFFDHPSWQDVAVPRVFSSMEKSVRVPNITRRNGEISAVNDKSIT